MNNTWFQNSITDKKKVQTQPAPLTEVYLRAVRLAEAMNTVEFLADLASWYNPGLHVAAGEVLQLVVDVQVPDAAVETGCVDGLGRETQRSRQHLLGHTCGHKQALLIQVEGVVLEFPLHNPLNLTANIEWHLPCSCLAPPLTI